MNAPQDERLLDGLGELLSDHQLLYQKLRAWHWTVTGPHFFGLHERFELLYTEMAEAVDELAERIVALGARPPLTLVRQLELASLREDDSVPPAPEMVARILADLEALDVRLRAMARRAEELGDGPSFDLLDGLANGRAKTAWMLRAFLAA